ncbi:hypothetical protein LINGRAHAP2_LOCUS33087 [Linum grandiflorum]
MVVALPKFVVFRSDSAGGKYVNHVSDDNNGSGELNNILAAKGDRVMNPHSRFEVETSISQPTTMVHIRCLYNNKYLRRSSEGEWWISATADKPDEDNKTSWSSTLFQPEFPTDEGANQAVVRLLHPQTGRYVQLYHDDENKAENKFSMCLWVDTTSEEDDDEKSKKKSLFEYVDWETVVVVPAKNVAFRADTAMYLGVAEAAVLPYLQFMFDDVEDKVVDNEILTLADGSLVVKNVSQAAYWSPAPDLYDYIWAFYLQGPRSTNLFRPVKVNNHMIAIRHVETNKLCTRYSDSVKEGLIANASDITPYSQLALTELHVTSRKVTDIEFRLSHGRVYNQTVDEEVLHPEMPVTNETDQTAVIKVKIPYKNEKTETIWKPTNSSLKLGPTVTIQPDQIPQVVASGDSIEMVGLSSGESYVWGSEEGNNIKGGRRDVRVVEVTVPGRSKVKVKLVAKFAWCDVPLNYTRVDTFNGDDDDEEIYYMDDGLYSGGNYFGFRVETSSPEPIVVIKM